MQTCTGCRKQKVPDDFIRFKRTNLTCNACSERHRTRKAKVAAQNTGSSPEDKTSSATTDATTTNTSTTSAKKEQEYISGLDSSLGLGEIGREAIEPLHLGKGQDFEDALVRAGAQLGVLNSIPTHPVRIGDYMMEQLYPAQRTASMQSDDSSVGNVTSVSASEDWYVYVDKDDKQSVWQGLE